jgi:glucose repression regulatory protein TUP1
MIRRAIWNLQNQLQQCHQRFEDERLKLFAELRQQRAAAGLPPPSPLRELSHPLTVSNPPSGSLPPCQLPDDVERESSRERNLKSRGRDYPDFDRDEHREAKRLRSNDRQQGVHYVPFITTPS